MNCVICGRDAGIVLTDTPTEGHATGVCLECGWRVSSAIALLHEALGADRLMELVAAVPALPTDGFADSDGVDTADAIARLIGGA